MAERSASTHNFVEVDLGTAFLWINRGDIRKIVTSADNDHLEVIYKDNSSDVFFGFQARDVAKALDLGATFETDDHGDFHIEGGRFYGTRKQYWRRHGVRTAA